MPDHYASKGTEPCDHAFQYWLIAAWSVVCFWLSLGEEVVQNSHAEALTRKPCYRKIQDPDRLVARLTSVLVDVTETNVQVSPPSGHRDSNSVELY